MAARTRKHLQQALGPGEEVRAVVKGHSKQALAVLDDRLIIVKPGFQADAGFGAKVSAFPYRQIQGINLRTVMLSAGIEILSSAYPRSVTEVGDGKKVRKALAGALAAPFRPGRRSAIGEPPRSANRIHSPSGRCFQ